MKYIKCNILNPVSEKKCEYLKDVIITIDNNIIKDIVSSQEFNSTKIEIIDKSDKVIIPGLIDTHVHLSQWRIRGRYKSDLLDWLNTYTFPEEEKLNNPDYAQNVAQDFFKNLIQVGTTTASIYVTSSQKATNIAFEEADKISIRALIGKVCMDQNTPPGLIENTDKSFNESVELCQQWDKKGLLNYVFTPRFAPVCSSNLMSKIGNYAQENDKYIQTHLSENHNEIALVKKLFPEAKSYTDVYYRANLLGPKTIMAHVIHLDDKELELMKNSNTKIAHCPDSNFFLKSGRFPYKKLIDNNLTLGLGSDVAGGTSLDMFYQMRMANYMQLDYSIEVEELFYLATLGNAKVLSKDDIIGNIEIGKEADLLVLNINPQQTIQELLSELIFVRGKDAVEEVYISGKKVTI
ncbi:guanine deaminase [bacterium]|nr:guanine deaminase [bacterium]